MTPHLNLLVKMVQMRGHNLPVGINAELTKIIPKYHNTPSYLELYLNYCGKSSTEVVCITILKISVISLLSRVLIT